MSSYNKLIVIGNLTRDPELSFTAANLAICKGGIAVNNSKKPDKPCFLDFTVFGKQAEAFAAHHSRGSSVLLEGRLDLDTWEAKDGGGKRSKHVMMVEQWNFVGPKAAGGGNNGKVEAQTGVPVEADPFG